MRKLFFKIKNKIKFICFNPKRFAKSVGVKVGSNTIIMTKFFGTEPYLINIGNNSEITSGVRFIPNDGAVWVLRNLYN